MRICGRRVSSGIPTLDALFHDDILYSDSPRSIHSLVLFQRLLRHDVWFRRVMNVGIGMMVGRIYPLLERETNIAVISSVVGDMQAQLDTIPLLGDFYYSGM